MKLKEIAGSWQDYYRVRKDLRLYRSMFRSAFIFTASSHSLFAKWPRTLILLAWFADNIYMVLLKIKWRVVLELRLGVEYWLHDQEKTLLFRWRWKPNSFSLLKQRADHGFSYPLGTRCLGWSLPMFGGPPIVLGVVTFQGRHFEVVSITLSQSS